MKKCAIHRISFKRQEIQRRFALHNETKTMSRNPESDLMELTLFEQLSSVLSHEIRSVCCNLKSIYHLKEVDAEAVEDGKLDEALPILLNKLDERVIFLIKMLDNTENGQQLLKGLNDFRFALNN